MSTMARSAERRLGYASEAFIGCEEQPHACIEEATSRPSRRFAGPSEAGRAPIAIASARIGTGIVGSRFESTMPSCPHQISILSLRHVSVDHAAP